MPAEPVAEVGLASGQPATRRASTRKRGVIIVMTIGAILAVVGIAGLAIVNQRSSDQGASIVTAGNTGTSSGSTSVSGSGDNSGSETSPTGTARDLTSRARLSASSTLKGYPVSNLVDRRLSVAWAEGVSGYGRGQWIGFTFGHDVWVSEVRVVPGYVKYDSKHNVDRWYSNGRVASAKLVFSDGTETGKFTFDTDDKGWQVMTLPEPVKTNAVKFVITGIARAQTGTKHDATDTTIAEMRVVGFTH
jgi:hypothetical protein